MFVRFAIAVLGVFLISTSVSTPAVAAGDDPVVAKVNGKEIKRSEVARAQTLLPQQYRNIPMEMILPTLVDSLVDGVIAADYALEKKLNETPEFKNEMARIERQLLQRFALSQEINANVTDEAVKTRFERFLATTGAQEEVHARHILLKTEDEAKAVIAELDKGVDFVELAKKKSTGPSASTGGDLGFFGRGQMVPVFEKTAFELEKGTYTAAPVKSQFGYHVIKLEDRRESAAPTFAESEARMRSELTQEVGTAFIERLRLGAKIEKFNLDGSPLSAKKEDKPAKKKE